MTKIRVHEYAKQVNKSSKEVIEALNKLNVSVTNHMSMLENDTVTKLNQSFKPASDKKKRRNNLLKMYHNDHKLMGNRNHNNR